MFFVWDVNGVQRPHVSRPAASRNRVIEQVSATHPNDKVEQHKKDDEPDLATTKSSAVIAEYKKVQKETKDRQPAILASAIMSSPVLTLPITSTLKDASKVFRDRRFRHIPIVSDKGTLVGVLSDRDVLRETIASPDTGNLLVKDVMATEAISARPETSIREIARLMFEERIGSVPIVDEHGTLQGMITRADVLRTVVNEAPLELWI